MRSDAARASANAMAIDTTEWRAPCVPRVADVVCSLVDVFRGL